jgi:hypothetical protein
MVQMKLYKTLYKELKNERITIVLLDENIGRARVRNLFLKYARYENMLFLDCDSLIINSDFLKSYFECISKQIAVVCGGRVYPEKNENKKYALHWKYGTFGESKMITTRKQHFNKSFMTNNFYD